MKQFALLAVLVAAVIGASAAAGTVRTNDMAAKTAEDVQAASAAAASAENEATLATPAEVSAADLQVLIDTTPELVILDARSEAQYAEGHIPGAVLMRPDAINAEALAALAPAKDTPMVFYCGNRECPASGKAAHKAAELEYTALYKYTDGIEDWRAKGLPVIGQ